MTTELGTEAANCVSPDVAPAPSPEPEPEPEPISVPIPARELEPPGGILLDAWQTPLDWGNFEMVTKISMVDGAVPGEAFVLFEQAPGAQIYLAPDEIQRSIKALSLALVAMRGFDPGAEEAAEAA